MTDQMPFGTVRRLTFSLPAERWEVAEPTDGLAFVAHRIGEFPYFRPTITAQEHALTGDGSISDLAGQLFAELKEWDAAAEANTELVDPEQGHVLQQVTFHLYAEDMPPLQLVQWQALAELSAPDAPHRQALALVLTCPADEVGAYADDFQAFLAGA